MSDLGSQLSKMFGDYKSTEITTAKTVTNTDHFRSSTTNSYDKCIRELSSKFPEGVADQEAYSEGGVRQDKQGSRKAPETV
jgi:hypothetical protein